MDIRVRIAISTINAKSFDEQQIKAIKLIEELGNTIPSKIKKALLSNCDRKDKEG